jgi:ribokinase
MFDVITIGSATVDVFMKSSQFHLQHAAEGVLLCQEYGGKLDIDHFEMQSGGAGTNTAVGFARLGFHTAAVVEIGQDVLAQVVWDELRREKVVTDFVISEKTEQTAVSVLLVSGDGGRSALTHRGAASMLEARDLPWEALTHTRWVHLSNVGGNKELLLQLFDHLKPSLVGVSWTPGSKELEMIAAGQIQVSAIVCDILVVNKEEWQVVAEQQSKILNQVPYVIITDGRNGGQLYIKGQYDYQYQIQEVQVVQETGAGDAFATGYVAGHLLGRPPHECCDWGVRNSASVVKHMGAKTGLLRRAEFGM